MHRAVASGRSRARMAPAALCLTLALAAALPPLSGCNASREPLTISRDALGTVVVVTAWGSDREALRSGVEAAFGEMEKVSSQLDAYDRASETAAIDRTPGEWHALPADAVTVMGRVGKLGVEEWFSSELFGVTALYDFGGEGSIPTARQLDAAVRASRSLIRDGDRVRFELPLGPEASSLATLPASGGPGLDFGGSAKGLALDRAMTRLRRTRGIEAALISTVSSTVAWGRKPDGEPWRIGIEDPRAPGRVLAVVTSDESATLNVSTSGDYQKYFERDGIRYHHILDPKTGLPARGVRSLTVFGRIDGLDADILSTALFVAGPDRALEYARAAGVGVYLVDAKGGDSASVPTGLGDVALENQAEPKR